MLSSQVSRGRRTLVLTWITLLAGSSLPAQFSERVEISIANVDVHVTDEKGKTVRGLTKDDFELYENGRLQTITNFSAISSAPSLPDQLESGALASADSPVKTRPRLVVLFVDIGDMEPSRRKPFFEGVRGFLHSALREGDLLTVLTWNHRVRVAVPPTSDHSRIDRLIDIMAAPFGMRDPEMARQIAELGIEQAEADIEIARSIGIGPEADAAATRDFVEWVAGEERCAAIRRKTREIHNMIASFSSVDRQKVMIFASDDLPMSAGPGCSMRHEYEALANSANAYGMTIHTFHPPGVRDRFIGPDRGGSLPGTRDPAPGTAEYGRTHGERQGLLLLAQRTGGLTGAGAVQSSSVLARVAQELDVFYSIGYRMEPGRDDKPRDIKVRTKNRKYRVRTRESVVFLSDRRRVHDLVTTSLYLPDRAGPQSPAFDVKIGALKRDGRFRLVPVEISIHASDLVVIPSPGGKSKGSFSIFVAGGREVGDASDVVELKQEFERDADEAITYSFMSKIRPDTRRLSIAVRDNISGEVASKVVALAP